MSYTLISNTSIVTYYFNPSLFLGEDIVRRCVAGCKAEDALTGSNPIELPAKPIKSSTMKMTAGQ